MSYRISSVVPIRAAVFAICSLTPAPVSSQSWKLPERGAAYALRRGPSLAVTIVRADGSGESRFIVDRQTPRTAVSAVPIPGGVRYCFVSPVKNPELGPFVLRTELDVLGPDAAGAHDLIPRVVELDPSLQVWSFGVELELTDVPGRQSLLIPVYGGGEFDEPAATIPESAPIDTGASSSVQCTSYYADDGTGLSLLALDPRGLEPKHFLYRTSGERRSLRMALEFYAPCGDPSQAGVEAPVPIRVQPFRFDPQDGDGWFKAAKLYRTWLEAHATGTGGLLSRGRLEDRSDVPEWMKELDLSISESWGFFPHDADPRVPAPLFELRRLQRDLGAHHVLVGLWFWQDRTSDLGRNGSYVPDPRTALQVRQLRPDGIRVIGYTRPGSFDIQNPLLHALGLGTEGIEDRAGKPRIVVSGHDLQMRPYWQLLMDTSSRKLADWYEVLAAYHADQCGMSGYYVDFPAEVGQPDWRRPAGRALGVTVDAYAGFADKLSRMRRGAERAGHDFASLHESAFEWLVPHAAGEGAVGVLGRAYEDDARTRGVPFFQAVYSGYTLFWPADEGYGPAALLISGRAYGDPADCNMTRSLAEGFTWGAVPNSSELALREGKLFYEDLGWLPPAFRTMLRHHRDTLKRLISLRRQARPWLVYGELLQSPVVGGDLHTLEVERCFGERRVSQEFEKHAVPTRAWRARDGSIRLVAVNGGPVQSRVVVDLRRLGLAPETELVDPGSSLRFGPEPGSGTIEVTVSGGCGLLLEPRPPAGPGGAALR